MINEKQMTLYGDIADNDQPDSWLISEKYDGCRAYWDGSQLWTRGGNVINAPKWFTRDLPADQQLDGEIWAGRGRFTEARLAVQYGTFTAACKFMVFDAPTAAGTWSKRMATVCTTSASEPVAFHVATTRDDLFQEMLQVQSAGGEGLIIRRDDFDGYEASRTRNTLKVKHAPSARWEDFQ